MGRKAKPKRLPSLAVRLYDWRGQLHSRIDKAHAWYCQQLLAAGLTE